MVWWIVLGLIVGLIALILFMPIGADVSYMGGELRVSAKVCGVLIELLPKKLKEGHEKKDKPKKEKKPKKPKKEKAPPDPSQPAKKKKLSLELSREELLELVKKALKGLGKFGKLQVDRFLLHYVAGGEDPYDTVKTFNFVNSALCILAPICGRTFKVKEYDVTTDIDFTSQETKIDAALCIVIRLSQVLHVAFSVAFGALGVLMKNKLRLWREKRRHKGEAAETETDMENNITQEERMDSNG